MTKKYLLYQVVNLVLYLSLQVLFQILLPAKYNTVFIYIGFFLLQPWSKKLLFYHLIGAFIVGSFLDVVYYMPGSHAFAAVLLVYFRYYLLLFLIPTFHKDRLYVATPIVTRLGPQKFFFYSLMLVNFYHLLVYMLDGYFGKDWAYGMQSFFVSTFLCFISIYVPLVGFKLLSMEN